jgi:periplasmic copper chaperone A
MRYLSLLALLWSALAWADITVENAWTRATPPGAKIAAGYMTIRNASSSADKLVGGSSPAAEKVETHVTMKDGDIARMREVKGYNIPPNDAIELKPGGAHLMLVNVKAPLKEGDVVPLVLKFERSGEVKVDLHVQAMGSSGGAMGNHTGGHMGGHTGGHGH